MSSGVKPAPPAEMGTPTDEQVRETTANIRNGLRRLRLDDMASLAEQQHLALGPIVDEQIEWLEQIKSNTTHYFVYLANTWLDVLKGLSRRWWDLDDVAAIFFCAYGATVILSAIWVWCFISTAPLVVYLYTMTAGRSSRGISLVNAMNPHLFKNLTPEQASAAKDELSKAPEPAPQGVRTFSLDIARLLLQVSCLMYERSHEDMKTAVRNVQQNVQADPFSYYMGSAQKASTDAPGALFSKVVGDHAAQGMADDVYATEKQSRDLIDKWAKSYGICFEPVSELASLSMAYCSVFWDPRSTWVIVAFKGTDPRSFEEWATDFTVRFADTSEHIPGFTYVHRGFKERIFPSNMGDGHRKPWETISAAIALISAELVKYRPQGTRCNVWFTGHSLGTALASLCYAKALICPQDIGPNAVLRDAYLYATPITTDVASRDAFNNALFGDSSVPRMLWRVTNRDDFVATGLPALGDSDKYNLGDDNLFMFSHLGIEIFMKNGPHPCEVKGNKVKGHGTFKVRISSKFSPEDVMAQRKAAEEKGITVSKLYLAMQSIPMMGRLAAHASTNYYDQLDQIAIKECVDRVQ